MVKTSASVSENSVLGFHISVYMIIATPQLYALIYKDYICYKENQYSVSVLLALYFYIISTSTSTFKLVN